MFTEPYNFVKVIKNLIDKRIRELNIGLSIWQVSDISNKNNVDEITDFRCNIKHLNFIYTLDNVPFVGIGLGHKKGIIKHPAIGDFVVVAFIGEKPVILGTIFDTFTQNQDSVPLIKLNELLIVQKENGSIILMKENNDVLIRAADSLGNFSNGAKIRINADGSFRLFNRGNYGIECDALGNLTLRGITINSVNTGGVW